MNEISKKQQCMTSLDIAAVTGKPHGDVLKAIRKMEPAWERECGGKFSCTSERVKMPQGGVRLIPVFELTKTESLYIATKFNDEARARLVLRWEQLEREQRRVNNEKMTEGQKLLITQSELIRKTDDIRREQISEENADADGCMTVKEIAQILGTTTKALNKLLVDQGIQYWNGGHYKLKDTYKDSGYAQYRNFHYYGLDGEKKERSYLVWTALGMEMMRTIIK